MDLSTCVQAWVYREGDSRGWSGTVALSRKAASSRADWLLPHSRQICNSIKCPSKWRWGVTERGVEREWECQCWLADRQDSEVSACSLAFRQTSQGPSRELIDSIQDLMVGRRESQQATALHTAYWARAPYTQRCLTDNNYRGHDLHILCSGLLLIQCLWVWRRRNQKWGNKLTTLSN